MEFLAVFTPLVGFLIAGLWGKKIGDQGAQFVTCAGMVIASFASLLLFFDVVIGANPFTTVLGTWIESGPFKVEWALRIDQLSVVMLCVVNIVSTCVHIYSIGYMSHDKCKARFMAYLSLFTFAMLMLVTADNLLQLFFGWEGVGLASYLLIGFWSHKKSANAAAIKAFVVNRIGDFGLALGIMAAFVVFGSVGFDDMFAKAPELADKTLHFWGNDFHALTVVCLLLFMGAMGKSAQLGLHTWLPDAMEGPTPVSALIHAATMVTAGVFLVARMSPVFEYAPDALMVVTVVGGATAFVAATIGMTQFDIKRVIAYSTMSQLGYMFFALGVSAYGAAIFHLVTHAFFKALLFLGAGSVIHAVSDEQDMRRMGGLSGKIKVTYVLMWIGSLALAGIPPLAGFYSKDIILEAAWADHTWFGDFAFYMGIAAAFMTAFYSFRLLFMTFHGKPRAPKKVMEQTHESPRIMLGPLFVLATGAVLAGFVFYGGFVGSANYGAEESANSIESSKSGSLESLKSRSVESLKSRSVESLKSRSIESLKSRSVESSKSRSVESSKSRSVKNTENYSAKTTEAHGESLRYVKSKNGRKEGSGKEPKNSGKIAGETSKIVGEKRGAVEAGKAISSFQWNRDYFWGDSIFVRHENDTIEAAHSAPLKIKLLPLIVALLGIGLAYLAYIVRTDLPERVVRVFAPLHRLFFNKWYFDKIYNRLLVRPAFALGRLFWVYGDKKTIDRFGPDGMAEITRDLAGLISRFQSGYIYQYALVMIIALVGLVSWIAYKLYGGG